MKSKPNLSRSAPIAGASADRASAFVSQMVCGLNVRAGLPAVASNRAFIRAWVARRARVTKRPL